MTIKRFCISCGAALDAFEVKPHICVPKEKTVGEMTTKELIEAIKKEEEKK